MKEFAPLTHDIQDVLITPQEIQDQVSAIGKQISRDFLGRKLLIVGVLKGVLFFMADVLRNISIPVEIDFIAVSSYTPETRDQGYVRIVKDLDIPIGNRNVLFVEDVIDTGMTLHYILQNLQTRQPASLEVCVLFNKPTHRLIEIPIKYKGFDLPDEFVVGYGLDYREKYRNLPFVGLLKPDVFRGN
jgi:hypoxanthine phosphoribosyltransferase